MFAHIEYKGASHTFEKPMHMNERQFLDRCWFIVKNDSPDNVNVKAFADLWLSHKYYHCQYDAEIMRTIQAMDDKIWAA